MADAGMQSGRKKMTAENEYIKGDVVYNNVPQWHTAWQLPCYSEVMII